MSLFHHAGRLIQKYGVDQCCKIENQRLKIHRYACSNGHACDPLSSRFPVETDNMRAQYQDAMAIVRAVGKPDLFITVTCNPQWPEITQELLQQQKAIDRPDLTARVFRLKLKAMLEDLSAEVLGLEISRIHVIVTDADKRTAEFSDPANAQLYETISKSMMHGPCGRSKPHAPCMKDGTCSKRFPKSFCEETRQTQGGYPMYRRRNVTRPNNVVLDNRHVVPYNPWLSHKYNCHINVEVCATVSSVKNLYKYVYKRHDWVAVSSHEPLDEIQQYLDAQYISASQAISTNFGYEMQAKTITVVQLLIHLENQQGVVFRKHETAESVLDRNHHTMLTRFFQLTANDVYARTLT